MHRRAHKETRDEPHLLLYISSNLGLIGVGPTIRFNTWWKGDLRLNISDATSTLRHIFYHVFYFTVGATPIKLKI